MRRGLIAAVVASALALGALAALAWTWRAVHAPADPADRTPRRVTVARGEPLSRVVERLGRRGLVRHPRVLAAWARLRGADRHVHAGTYAMSPSESPVDLLERLARGDVLRVSVTIPEGFTMWDIAGAFRAAGIDSVAMLAAIADPDRIRRRGIPAPTLEGYLFPDTYKVPWGADPREVVDMMLARLDEVFDDSLAAEAARRGMTRHEVLTLASIVEAEARRPDERRRISAVYHNRLRRGMRLEADPTVAYALGGHRGRLLYADLEVDSPYNTYRNPGLPPGPICSPGLASIRAAIDPDPECRALYFVARGDGSHIFSKTLREHRRAVERVRAERRRRARGERRPAR